MKLFLSVVLGFVIGAGLGLPSLALAQATGDVEELPATIPIFPLQDVVLFPNTSAPLHIFEPRYREMIADALVGDGVIGMVLLQPGYEADYYGRPPIYPVGCAGVITEAEELPDGRYLIALRGFVKFRVTGEDQSQAYRLADVEPLPEVLDDQEQAQLRDRRRQLVAMLETLETPEPPNLPDSLSDAEFIDWLAQVLGIPPGDRQSLLEADPLARADALMKMLASRSAVPL